MLLDCLSFPDSTNAVLRVAVRPAKWATGFVVGADVLRQLAPQIGGRGEAERCGDHPPGGARVGDLAGRLARRSLSASGSGRPEHKDPV